MARIGHIALLTKDTEKLAAFYKTSFGLNEVARSGEARREWQRDLSVRRPYQSGDSSGAQPARRDLSFRHASGRRQRAPRKPRSPPAPPAARRISPRMDASPKPSCSIRWAPGWIYRRDGKCKAIIKILLTNDAVRGARAVSLSHNNLARIAAYPLTAYKEGLCRSS